MRQATKAASRWMEPYATEEIQAKFRRFRATRDPDLRDGLIRHHIGLVRIVAGWLALRLPLHVCRDDLEASGVSGLLAAIENYDPDREVDFATYAQSRIRGAILDELRDLDPLPRSIRERARQIVRATAILEQRFLRAPTQEEVADFLGISIVALHRTLQTLKGGLFVSLDSGRPGSDQDDDGNEGDVPTPEAKGPSPWYDLALKERQVLLGAVLDTLPENERTVLSLYYYEQLTMKEIGAVLEVSESRISQIHSAALLQIRNRLRRQKLTREDLNLEEASL